MQYSRFSLVIFFIYSSVCVCVCVSVCVLVAQLCLILCNPMDCSLPGSSVHGILQARILECVAIPFSRESSRPRDQTQISCIRGRVFTVWATREAQWRIYVNPNLPIHSTLRDCHHTEWSKSEREKQISDINGYMWNLEKWSRWTMCSVILRKNF